MSIVERVKSYVLSEMKQKLSPDNHYHSIEHTLGVVAISEKIASSYNLSEADLEDLLIASWFHDLGHINSYEDHESSSAKIAREFLRKNGHPEARIKQVELIIRSTSMNVPSQGLLEEIIHDADIQSIGNKEFFSIGNNLRREWELVEGMFYDQQEWNRLQLDFLESNDFYTDYARSQYGPVRERNIEIAKARIEAGNQESSQESH